MIMGLLFVEGIRTVCQDGLDPQKGLVVGVALALGVGLESGSVFEGVLGATWSASIGNGMTLGVLATVLLTGFLELTSSRRRRLDVELDVSAAAGIDDFLRRLAGRNGWNDASSARLRGAGEEALECLLQLRGGDAADRAPRLILFARPGRETVEMEFLVVSEKENIEDHLTYLSERAETPEESELSSACCCTTPRPCVTASTTASRSSPSRSPARASGSRGRRRSASRIECLVEVPVVVLGQVIASGRHCSGRGRPHADSAFGAFRAASRCCAGRSHGR